MRVLGVMLILFAHAAIARAQNEDISLDPELRVIVEPSHILRNGAYVQGQIRLRILLLSPHPFETLHFQQPILDGATVVTLSPPRTRPLTHYNKPGFGYETSLAVFPERSGTLTIPDITITGVTVSADGSSESFSTHGDATEIRVRPIDPTFSDKWWVVADSIEIEEQWTPAPETVAVGAVVERRVVMTVNGARLAQLPPLTQSEGDGYAVVGETGQESMEVTKLGVVSRIERAWKLRMLSGDVVQVDPIVIDYWDPDANQAAAAALPGKRIEPLARDVKAAREGLIEEAVNTHRGRQFGVMLLLAIPILIFVGLLFAFAFCIWPTRADRTLIRECRNADDASAGFAATLAWARASYPRAGGVPLATARAHLGERGAAALTRLQSAVFSRSAETVDTARDAHEIIRAARHARLRAFIQWMMAWLSRPFRARPLEPRARSVRRA